MSKVRVRCIPVYKPCATHTIIIGYNVWAWRGHVLLGKILGTQSFHKTKTAALKQAAYLRKFFNEE